MWNLWKQPSIRTKSSLSVKVCDSRSASDSQKGSRQTEQRPRQVSLYWLKQSLKSWYNMYSRPSISASSLQFRYKQSSMSRLSISIWSSSRPLVAVNSNLGGLFGNYKTRSELRIENSECLLTIGSKRRRIDRVTAILEESSPTSGVKFRKSWITSTGVISKTGFSAVGVSSWVEAVSVCSSKKNSLFFNCDVSAAACSFCWAPFLPRFLLFLLFLLLSGLSVSLPFLFLPPGPCFSDLALFWAAICS